MEIDHDAEPVSRQRGSAASSLAKADFRRTIVGRHVERRIGKRALDE